MCLRLLNCWKDRLLLKKHRMLQCQGQREGREQVRARLQGGLRTTSRAAGWQNKVTVWGNYY